MSGPVLTGVPAIAVAFLLGGFVAAISVRSLLAAGWQAQGQTEAAARAAFLRHALLGLVRLMAAALLVAVVSGDARAYVALVAGYLVARWTLLFLSLRGGSP